MLQNLVCMKGFRLIVIFYTINNKLLTNNKVNLQ